MAAVTLKFESDLDYQQTAIQAAVELFSGIASGRQGFSITGVGGPQLALTEYGVANPSLGDEPEDQLLANLQRIQARGHLPVSRELLGRHFTVEMETGTGKTYVYLRTIFELHARYGMGKFVIAVPSVAIREGVITSIELMRGHFDSLYSTPFDAQVYESKNLGRVRQFANASTLQILIINIDSFRKDVGTDPERDTKQANVINRPNDSMSGHAPIEFIRSCQPVVVVDEPQNMESPSAVAAIERLNPMCTLRYSATHRKLYNPIYRLGPVEAHELGLVKKIEVASVIEGDTLNAPFVRVVSTDQRRMRAQVRINVGAGSHGAQKSLWVKVGQDLYQRSGKRQEYATGYIVRNISFRPGDEYVEFSSGSVVYEGESIGGYDGAVARIQIRETVQQHLDRELSLLRKDRKIKVLSLIFLDKVANYRQYTKDGSRPGPYAEYFEEVYTELAAVERYADLKLPSVADVHGGYFSRDRATKKKPERLKDTTGKTRADEEVYELIMREKDRLLSLDVPLRFIFSHSALREGWDNPNVFQICTLNESKSLDRKRQEIGRGLRLCVGHDGERVRDSSLNRLTVIANEAYEDFARALQTEYEEDTGRKFGVVAPAAFSRLRHPEDHPANPGEELGVDAANVLWEHLREAGILGPDGSVLSTFKPDDDAFVLPVPVGWEPLRDEIVSIVARYANPIQIEDAKKRKRLTFRKAVTLDPDFRELWERISAQTRYRVSLDTERLVAEAVESIQHAEAITPPRITIRVADVKHERWGLEGREVQTPREVDADAPMILPDLLAELQNEVDLTRQTIVDILIQSGRLRDFVVNPQAFIALVSQTIGRLLRTEVLRGIEYHEMSGLKWEMRRLEPQTEDYVERYASRLYQVQNAGKTPFDHVEIDSEVERRFASDLDTHSDVLFYMKLPSWFTVDTPIGAYNPDWAIMFRTGMKLCLVRETKGTLDPSERRDSENTKINCAMKHFATIGVDYAVVRNMNDLARQVASCE